VTTNKKSIEIAFEAKFPINPKVKITQRLCYQNSITKEENKINLDETS